MEAMLCCQNITVILQLSLYASIVIWFCLSWLLRKSTVIYFRNPSLAMVCHWMLSNSFIQISQPSSHVQQQQSRMQWKLWSVMWQTWQKYTGPVIQLNVQCHYWQMAQVCTEGKGIQNRGTEWPVASTEMSENLSSNILLTENKRHAIMQCGKTRFRQ